MSDTRQHRLSLHAVCGKLRTAYQHKQLTVAKNGTFYATNNGVRALIERFDEIRPEGLTLYSVVRFGAEHVHRNNNKTSAPEAAV